MTIRTLATPVPSAQGLDVSNWQGPYDWAAAKKAYPQLAFGIYRLTQGLGAAGTNSPDPTAVRNHAQIAAQGLIRGAYHFLDPRLDGAAQARYFTDQAGKLGLTGQDMLWLDNEQAQGRTPAQVAACARDFMAELDKLAPHNPRGVYTFVSFARDGYNAGLGTYPLWLAYPAQKAPLQPPPWLSTQFLFWQWGTRNGIDADAFMGTPADLKTWIASFAPPSDARWHGEYVTAGLFSLAQVAAKLGYPPNTLLRMTAVHYKTFGDQLGAWLGAVLSGARPPTDPLPAGVKLWCD